MTRGKIVSPASSRCGDAVLLGEVERDRAKPEQFLTEGGVAGKRIGEEDSRQLDWEFTERGSKTDDVRRYRGAKPIPVADIYRSHKATS